MSTISTKPVPSTPFAPPAALPLQAGERMNVEEFLRRWDALPEEWKAHHKRVELIEGVVHMPPISGGYHGQSQFDFISFLGCYAWVTPGVRGFAPSSLILDAINMPEPDGILAIDPKCGGRIKLDGKGYIIGMPDLLAEIAASNVLYDLQTKKELYRKFEVKEYVVWRVKEKAIDWFILRGQDFELLATTDGVYRSEVFPGLWLAAGALVAGDFATVSRVLQDGIASPEHAAFVEQLKKQAGS
ncbi:MAG: Uma2 family endonuclease [Planctomycetes bacterium]|nr:Uma2 family endonuclease [Planctomycetota bacterium]